MRENQVLKKFDKGTWVSVGDRKRGLMPPPPFDPPFAGQNIFYDFF